MYSRVGAVQHPCSLTDPGDRGYQAGAASTVISLANRYQRGRDNHDGVRWWQDGCSLLDSGEDDGT